MSGITERVAAGAAFLDEHEPGWDRRIDLDELDIGSSCRCILGQLHGSFSGGLIALRYLDQELNWDVRCGFIWDTAVGAAKNEVTDLTAEWLRVITGRRSS